MHYPFRTGFRWLPGASLVALAAVVTAQLASASNLVQSSADFDRWSVYRGARVAANAGAAPDGSLTADQVFDSATENGARIFSNTVTANGGSYVFSCYLKAGSLAQAKLAIADGSGSSVRGYIQPSLSADWQRYSVAIPSSPSGSTLRVELYPGKFDKENGYVWAWGAQLEAGTTPSAYESTSGGAGGPDVTPPAVPTGLTAVLSNGTVQVQWTPNQEADIAGYRLQRSRDAGSFAVVAEPTEAAHQDANVSAGSTYEYRVAAVDASGNASAYSSSASVTLPLPDVTPPPASGKNLIQYPEEFEKWGSYREAGAVANAGAAPTGAATADRVVDSVTQNGGHLFSNTITADGGAYTLSCYLRAGTLAKAKLALFDAAGGSIRGFVEPTLTDTWQRYSVTVPNAPKGSTLRAVIYAGKFDKEDGYVWAWGAQLESGAAPTAYEPTTGGGGDSGPTPDTTPPAAPAGLSARLNGSAIQVQWTANGESDLAGYRVERGVNSTTAFSNLAAPTVASYDDAAVLKGNSYSYRVRAVDTTGNLSAASTVATVAIPLDEPTPTGALNVVNFGANPATGGDDAGAIQAAFNAAVTQNKDVYLPAGHYAISRTIVFKAHGRTVFGDGLDRTIIAGNTSSYNLLQLDRTRDVTVRDLRFEGSHLNTSDTANTGKAVECYSSQRTRISRIYAYGTGYIAFDNSGTQTTLEDSVCEDYGRIGFLINDGGIVRRCKFQNRDGWRMSSEMQGIYAAAGRDNILIEDNEFINVGIYAIQLWGSQNGVYTENITIQRNTFTKCPRVLVCAAGDSGPLYRNIRFLGNTIRGTTEKSLHIGKFNGSTATGTELLIEGNVFEDAGPGYGIFLTPWGGASLQGVRIRNNQFTAPNRSSYNGFINVSGAKDVIIEGNLFSGIGHDGASEIVSEGIHLRSGSQIAIRDNTFEHWSGAGVGRVVNAIRFEMSTTNVAIERNQFFGNGRVNCYGLNVQGAASATHGYVRDCLFRKAKLTLNGLPSSGNVVE